MTNENAFVLIAAWRKAAKKAGFSKDYIEKVTKDATSGDYDHLKKVLGY